MNRSLIALAGLVVAGGTAGGALLVASSGGEEDVVQQPETATPRLEAGATPTIEIPGVIAPAPAPTIPAGATLWRWVNVTVVVRDDTDLSVVQDSDPPGTMPPHIGPVLKLSKYGYDTGSSSSVVIDAETGVIIRQDLREEHRAEIQAVLDTLTVSPLNISSAAWPYTGEVPVGHQRETVGRMSFIRPPRDTGLVISSQLSDPGGLGVIITNGKSGVGVYVDEASGELRVNTEYLLPESEATFMRWVDSVKLCGVDVSC